MFLALTAQASRRKTHRGATRHRLAVGGRGVTMDRPMRLLRAATLLSLLCGWLPSVAHATVIEFQAIDSPDVVSGEDLWRYEYTLSGNTFDEDLGFSVFFDFTLYDNLQAAPAGSDWNVITLQPDPVIPDDGIYDALSLVNGASLAQPFSVSFNWLGPPGTTPGSQPFEVYRLEDDDTLSITESGETIPLGGPEPVPEPSTLFLVGSGLAAALRWRQRSR